ncbi:MAG: RDD family protein [Paludibacteraceae bacterium]|jgi:uncharacterized RDD family membrane protein YckC|nr:RDD family protein [Paludibacteraceae bacterium]
MNMKDSSQNRKDNSLLYITTGQYVKIRYKAAPIERRIIGLAIDFFLQILTTIGVFCIGYIIYDGLELDRSIDSNTAEVITTLVLMSIWIMNMVIEYLTKGRSLGKLITHTMVIGDNCAPPTLLQCFLRWLLLNVDVMLVGGILISYKSQRLGDMAAGCHVVMRPSIREQRVSIADDYAFVNNGYQVVYPNVRLLTQHDVEVIGRALYDNRYFSQTSIIAQKVAKKIQVDCDGNYQRFLIQVKNDFNYLTQIEEIQPSKK